MLFSKKIETKVAAKPVDHLAEMRRSIDAATSAAEKAGIRGAIIRDYFEGQLGYWRRRALFQADQANATRPMSDGRGGFVDPAAAAGRAQARREEARRLADRDAYQADLDRRFEADKIRNENRS